MASQLGDRDYNYVASYYEDCIHFGRKINARGQRMPYCQHWEKIIVGQNIQDTGCPSCLMYNMEPRLSRVAKILRKVADWFERR